VINRKSWTQLLPHSPQVTDTTTFTSEKRREKEDFWLYETCKRCLQHLIDVYIMVCVFFLLLFKLGCAG
jgi:hypothetical protein